MPSLDDLKLQRDGHLGAGRAFTRPVCLKCHHQIRDGEAMRASGFATVSDGRGRRCVKLHEHDGACPIPKGGA